MDAGLAEIVFLPTNPAYDESLTYYWSATTRDVKPSCFLQPRSTEDVAQALRALSKTSGVDDVAIRSGGHSPWASNNIAGGVTFDLSLFNQVVYSGDTVSIYYGMTSCPCVVARHFVSSLFPDQGCAMKYCSTDRVLACCVHWPRCKMGPGHAGNRKVQPDSHRRACRGCWRWRPAPRRRFVLLHGVCCHF